MTRRDFILLSKALSDCRERIRSMPFNNQIAQDAMDSQLRGVRRAAAFIADRIAEDNPTFDAARFLCDCGYGATNPAVVPPPPPRESARQIAQRIRRGEGPDPSLISNVNQRREEGR